MNSALQQAIEAIKQKTTTTLQNAAMTPVNYLQNKLGNTVIEGQNPGGLASPIPQQIGAKYNTDVPLVNYLRNKIIGNPKPSNQPAQIKQEKWWDSTNGMKYKHFDNPDEYNQAVSFMNKARGIKENFIPVKQSQPSQQEINNIQQVINTNPEAKFVPRNGEIKINPYVKKFLEETVFPITDEKGIPRAVAAGQFAAEGRFKGLGANRNNFYNINAVDSNPNLAHSYQSPEEGVIAYADLIKRKYADALNQPDVATVIKMIEQLGYAGDPNTYYNRANNGYRSYSDFIQSVPEYRYYLNQ